ncbi:NAD-dependent epimerase/dehydratase family protein [Curtobacterium herbarum]|uniref:NAD-dependent epimerase/dehydratase domain-containing protein n=1 Tax=Curtobacterium herbarum TaxID=150122 RepID=A0ABN1ZH05_9MICO|nr:NAD(P)-dependent oxidoreductase [Curtobacterium herbarum]MBM7474993.1 UDP-glucose 4-epimerase [Curtobacterium herbarum]MCS6545636.1 NAD(P)-dependent oxidoreductase [Curtobacterium herbarum]
MSGATALVVGGGGFLGRAVVGALERAGDRVVVPRVPWNDTEAAATVLREAVTGLQAGDTPWRLVWCAGSGIVATGEQAFTAESTILERVLDPAGASPDTPGAVFFASSAGGVYAGASGAPFDEDTDPLPLAPYGRSRLAAEARFRDFAEATGTPLLVGRISNLYGPGANLRKPQGLVSQLALAHLERRPSSIYVPMDTTRDYLYIDDAAAMVADGLAVVADRAVGPTTTKIFASQHGRTITEVVEAVSAAFGEPLDVREGHDPAATSHGRDLRFRSRVMTALDDRTHVPFELGVRRTVDAIRGSRPTDQETA